MARASSSEPVPQRVIHSTERLLAQGGLAKASLNAIAADSAMPRGSLLHYFPEGKNQIVQAALKAHDETFSALLETSLVAGDGFAQSLAELMQGTATRMKA